MPRPTKPRPCRRRLQGQRVLTFVERFNIKGNGVTSVTAARKFVTANSLVSPVIIDVERNSYTIDHFFLAEEGMFGLSYVEVNWMLFPCLNELVKRKGASTLFGDLLEQDWTSEEESYRPEYAFI
jgi:hypothetical protein